MEGEWNETEGANLSIFPKDPLNYAESFTVYNKDAKMKKESISLQCFLTSR